MINPRIFEDCQRPVPIASLDDLLREASLVKREMLSVTSYLAIWENVGYLHSFPLL